MTNAVRHTLLLVPVVALTTAFAAPAQAQTPFPFTLFASNTQQQGWHQQNDLLQSTGEDVVQEEQSFELPEHLKRQIVQYPMNEAPGTIIVDTANTYLYLVLGDGRAMRYGIGVGRDGFTWSGTQRIANKQEWPDWRPPSEMIERQPYLPRFVAGGTHNPLGARALYLGSSVYRIHGTNQPHTIGQKVSSGCIRMTNEDVIDLYSRVEVGTKVVVLPAAGNLRANNDRDLPPKARQTKLKKMNLPAGLQGPSVIYASE